ncbi:hypothetical protein [uncultured Pseudoxanthomonas sp.]|uniref:hypothetical protein n=1 Tax=uncultured Pseudoxanthomonas sp. TaxID=281701 RepID=UPI00260483E2|nr:hypothetical protein [uncultured Pseudoxanthomonas sp.]
MDRPLYRAQLDQLRQTTWRGTAADGDAFAAFTAYDYSRRRRLHPDVAWEDACHVYAFAASSHVQYDGALDLDTELELEHDWERLRGEAGPDWPVARTLLREAWRWLDQHGAVTARVH